MCLCCKGGPLIKSLLVGRLGTSVAARHDPECSASSDIVGRGYSLKSAGVAVSLAVKVRPAVPSDGNRDREKWAQLSCCHWSWPHSLPETQRAAPEPNLPTAGPWGAQSR
jgi:hypothetical protein